MTLETAHGVFSMDAERWVSNSRKSISWQQLVTGFSTNPILPITGERTQTLPRAEKFSTPLPIIAPICTRSPPNTPQATTPSSMPDIKIVSAVVSITGALVGVAVRCLPLRKWAHRITRRLIKSRLWVLSKPAPDLEMGSGPLGEIDDPHACRTLHQVYDVSLSVFQLYTVRQGRTASGGGAKTKHAPEWPRSVS
jgi:hypothetical protein